MADDMRETPIARRLRGGNGLRRLLQEPLLHFLLVGSLLFVGYGYLERIRGGDASPDEIRLRLDDLAQLEILFESKWKRAPTLEEFNALIEQRIREQVLYREALALGLDKDDTIVRRRMAQKMKFLAEDVAAASEPTNEELRAWFQAHHDLFVRPPRISFRHIYFAGDRRREHAQENAEQALAQLADEPEDSTRVGSLADPFMFQDYYGDRSAQEIAREFGPEFALAGNRGRTTISLVNDIPVFASPSSATQPSISRISGSVGFITH